MIKRQIFSQKELDSMTKFREKHLNCYKNPESQCNRIKFTIHHIYTGIGIQTYMECDCCGEQEEVTDYEIW